MADPVISAVVYTVTDTTISATWTTDISSNSSMTAGGKSAIDSGIAANSTSHQCIVTGLKPSTAYSCVVTSGATNSTPSTQTTSALQTRTIITSAKTGSVTQGSVNNNFSDTQRTFLSSDSSVYITGDDTYGFIVGTPHSPAGYNFTVSKLTDETAMTGASNLLTLYGDANSNTGTDGPGGTVMTNKTSGIFGLNGNLYVFAYRQKAGSSNRYCNWIKSTDHGATWNNFNDLTNFIAGGNPVTPYDPTEPVQFYVNTIGIVTPVLYAADDGTLGYTTAGNQIDGGNAYVYMAYSKDNDTTTLFMMRLSRIQFDAQNAAPMQYWKGPTYPSPLDFTNDNNWSSASADAVNIKPANSNQFFGMGLWQQMAFVPAIKSYIMSLSLSYDGTANSIWVMYSAPTPAGPWTLFFTQPNTVSPNQWYGFFVYHKDIAANALSSDITSKFLYAGTIGSARYCVNYSTLTMLPSSGATMQQLIWYGFTTVENPLSNGSNFSIPSGTGWSALRVPSTGVCEASVASSTTCGAFWSGAVPSGDTGGLWPADHYVEVTIPALLAADLVVIGVRQSTSANTRYQWVVAASTNSPASRAQATYAIVAGSAAATFASFNATIAAGDVLRMSVAANVLTLTQNGTVIQTITDSGNNVPAAGGGPVFAVVSATTIGQSYVGTFAGGANQAAAPTFSPIGNNYVGTQTVTITGPASSTIYYTTDGTTPTRSSSSIASGATISVTSSKTVKAIASKTNFIDSQISGATYAISSSTVSGGAGSLRLRRRKRIYAIS